MSRGRDRWQLAQAALHALDHHEGEIRLPADVAVPVRIRRLHHGRDHVVLDRGSTIGWVLDVAASAAAPPRIAAPSVYH